MDNKLFEPIELAGIKFQNRILRAATDESMADECGKPTSQLVQLYTKLAKGEVGGIITGYISVSEEGKTSMPGMCSLHTDDNIASYQELVNAVHEYQTPIIAQIAHCGRHSVSGKTFDVNKMSDEQFQQMILDFTNTAIRCQKAGFDGIELHCAHGYFLSEVLSASKNHRKDVWGGSKEKRVSLVELMIKSIRKCLPEYPIFVKLNGEELVKRGTTPKLAAWYAKTMERAGASAIEVSRGLQENFFDVTRGQVPIDMALAEFKPLRHLPKPVKAVIKPVAVKMLTPKRPYHLYNLDAAKLIKEKVKIPVIVVGGLKTIQDCENALNHGMDLVSISRPLITEPDLVRKWKEGKQQDSKCIACNYCLIGIGSRPLRCYYGKVPKNID